MVYKGLSVLDLPHLSLCIKSLVHHSLFSFLPITYSSTTTNYKTLKSYNYTNYQHSRVLSTNCYMTSTLAQPQCLKDPSQEWLRDEKDAMQVGIQSVNRRALKTARVTSGRRDKDKRQASRRSHSNYHNDTLLGSKHHHSSLLVIITHLRNTTFPPTRWTSQLLTQPPTNKHLLRGSPLSY